MQTKRKQTETDEQIKLIQFLETWKVDLRWHHSPNQRAGWKWGKKLKMMGVSPGFPDLLFFNREGQEYAFAFIEMKSKTGKLQKNQQDWLGDLGRACPVITSVAKSAAEAIDFLNQVWPEKFANIDEYVMNLATCTIYGLGE